MDLKTMKHVLKLEYHYNHITKEHYHIINNWLDNTFTEKEE